jgi:hypothetical protein
VCAVTRARSKKVAGNKSCVEEDVSDSTMVDMSEMFVGDPDFAKLPEMTSPLKNPKGERCLGSS